MFRHFAGLTIVMGLCLAVSLADAAPRGKGGGEPRGGSSAGRKPEEKEGKQPGHESSGERQEKSGKKSPGGNWSEPNSGGKHHNEQSGSAHNESGAEGAAAARKKQPQDSGAQGAAAGAAAAKNKQPQASGAQGAAAGAAAANRNAPKASGAQGAAAGAAVANRNAPNVSGAQGAAAGAAVANRNAPNVSGAAGAAAGYAAVRSSFDRPDMYGQQWYVDHRGAWSTAGLAAGAAWAPSTWAAVSSYGGYGNNTPVSYNYGVNVTCVDGNVSVDGQNIGTAEEFSQQAADLAETGTEAKTSATEQWLPLGVFAMVRNENDHPHLILQLAINKQGVLRGNYTDEATDHTLPIHGAVDQQTKRVAFTVGDNKNCVLEAGLSNLTQGEAPALIHKNGQTERWVLVRLEKSNPRGSDAAPANAQN